MKSNEFYQTVNTTLYLSNKIENLKEILPFIDEIRKYHKKLQEKLEYLLLDIISYESPEEKEKINSIAVEIKRIANEVNIQCGFHKLPKEFSEFSNQFREQKTFASYSYNGINITGLIVYTENKKKFKPKNPSDDGKEELKNISFEDLKVLDENGNDLNTLPGLE